MSKANNKSGFWAMMLVVKFAGVLALAYVVLLGSSIGAQWFTKSRVFSQAMEGDPKALEQTLPRISEQKLLSLIPVLNRPSTADKMSFSNGFVYYPLRNHAGKLVPLFVRLLRDRSDAATKPDILFALIKHDPSLSQTMAAIEKAPMSYKQVIFRQTAWLAMVAGRMRVMSLLARWLGDKRPAGHDMPGGSKTSRMCDIALWRMVQLMSGRAPLDGVPPLHSTSREALRQKVLGWWKAPKRSALATAGWAHVIIKRAIPYRYGIHSVMWGVHVDWLPKFPLVALSRDSLRSHAMGGMLWISNSMWAPWIAMNTVYSDNILHSPRRRERQFPYQALSSRDSHTVLGPLPVGAQTIHFQVKKRVVTRRIFVKQDKSTVVTFLP